MKAFRKLPRAFRWPWRDRAQILGEVDEEIAFHLDMRVEKLVRSGLAEREAREQALREFGDVAELRGSLGRTDEAAERRRGWGEGLEDLRQDVRLAVRSLSRSPGFTAVALTTLALGIGSAVAIFSLVNSVLLRPLPYPEPERLVQVSPGQNFNMALADEVGAAAPSLEASTGVTGWLLTLTGQGEPALLHAQRVDADFFRVFQVQPALGRAFLPEERDPARSDVVIISHGLWQSRFGGDPAVVGRTIRLDGGGHRSHQVIGVMPAGFRAPFEGPRDPVLAWTPLSRAGPRTVATDSTWYINQVVGRLAAGATVEVAAREVKAAMAAIRAEHGNLLPQESVRTAGAIGLLDSMVGDVRPRLAVLLAAVGLVLLLACANLANLFLARGAQRRQELAVRTALGATRGRLLRKLLTESLVLALLGGAAGVGVAQLLLAGLRVARESGLPRSGELSLDLPVLGFAVAVSVGSVVLFGLFPALRASGAALRDEMGAGTRAPGPGRASRRVGAGLIALEVALAMVLVTGAGLLLSTLRELRSVDPGMDTHDVLALELSLPEGDYRGERAVAFYSAARERLAALGGVAEVGAIHLLPFTDNNWNFPYLAEGHAPPADGPFPSANFRVVTPGYFGAVDVPLLAGRRIDEGDRAGQPTVGIINRSLADRLWPGEDPIGRTIQLFFGDHLVRVVGVVGDARQHGLDLLPAPEIYLPLSQVPLSSMVMMVETDLEPAALARAAQEAIWALDPNVVIRSARPLDVVVGESIRSRRFFAGVLTFFGGVALLLGAVGVYGVMVYAIGARTREFGVRMALGASAGRVARGALVSGLVPVLVGLGVGTAGALATTRLLSGLLFGLGARDPLTLAAAALVLGFVAALASWLPARRVTRLDPSAVLRAE